MCTNINIVYTRVTFLSKHLSSINIRRRILCFGQTEKLGTVIEVSGSTKVNITLEMKE